MSKNNPFPRGEVPVSTLASNLVKPKYYQWILTEYPHRYITIKDSGNMGHMSICLRLLGDQGWTLITYSISNARNVMSAVVMENPNWKLQTE